jgi:hypothetical protein
MMSHAPAADPARQGRGVRKAGGWPGAAGQRGAGSSCTPRGAGELPGVERRVRPAASGLLMAAADRGLGRPFQPGDELLQPLVVFRAGPSVEQRVSYAPHRFWVLGDEALDEVAHELHI